jgi:hypothetical protein
MKIWKGGLMAAFASMLAVPLASAIYIGSINTGRISEQIIQFYQDFFTPIFRAIFGGYNTDSFLFAKILLFFLLIFVIKFAIGKTTFFEDQKKLSTIIAIIVSILSIRFMPENYITDFVMVPYSTLGIAITVLMPFLIFFFFVHKSGATKSGRKLLWGVYGIIFLVMWLTRDTISSAANWIYICGLGLVIACIIWDGAISRYFGMQDLEKATAGMDLQTRNSYLIRLNELNNAMATMSTVPPSMTAEKVKLIRLLNNIK